MKKAVIAMTFLMLIATVGYSLVEEIDNSWGQTGLKAFSSSPVGVEVNLSIGKFGLEDFNYDGNSYQSIVTEGIFLPADQGKPNFPAYSKTVAIPQGATARIEILDYRIQKYQNVIPVPAPEIPLDSDDSPMTYEKDVAIYNSSSIYPEEIALISDPYDIRGVDVVTFGIIPFQWDPVTKELTVYTDIKFRVVFEGGNGHFGEDRLRTMNWDRILRSILINYDQLLEIDYSKRAEIKLTEGRNNAEFVIIVPNNAAFIAWADTIAKFREEEGIISEVFTLTDIGGTSSSIIEAWIDNAYNTWAIPPEAILMLGDYPQITSPSYSSCVSDNIYGSISTNGGGDSLPDLIMGRICAQNATHLENMITKNLIYERTPPTDAGFYDHPTAACGYQTTRWFQIAAETIRGFWANTLGKNPVRVYATYSGSPAPGGIWSSNANTSIILNYFVPRGYITATIPAGINWNATKTDMLNTINNGTFIIQHRDHGSHTGWGEPDFQSSDISSCTNTATIWPYVYSTNCQTGEYQFGDPCFTEVFHREPGKGFLGVNAASGTSYSFVNDTYIWGNYDYMWPFFMDDYSGSGGWTEPGTTDVRPGIAMPYAKLFLNQSSWPYNPNSKLITYHLFHHHGDPYMRLFSNVPQTLTPTHASTITAGATSFAVDAPVHSYIALTVNGELIGRAAGTGSSQNVTIDPQTSGTVVKLVITQQDYYRYEQNLNVTGGGGGGDTLHSQVILSPSTASGYACQLDSVYPFEADIADDIHPPYEWRVDTIVSWWSCWNGFTSPTHVPNVHISVYADAGTIPAVTATQEIAVEAANCTWVGSNPYVLTLDLTSLPLTIPAGDWWFEIQPSNVFTVNGQTGWQHEIGIGNGQEVFFRSAVLGAPSWVTASASTPGWPAGVEAGFVLIGEEINAVEEETGNDLEINTVSLSVSNTLFNGKTTFSYAVASEGQVSLKLYDLTGREVLTFVNCYEQPGLRHVVFEGKDSRGNILPSGTYICNLITSSGAASTKVIITR